MTGKPALKESERKLDKNCPDWKRKHDNVSKEGMSYQFRIRGFGFQGSTPVYGDFTYINGTTIPSKVSGLYIGGTALYSEYQMITGNTKE